MNDKSTLEQTHKPRLTDPHASPVAFSAMLALQKAVNQCGLEPSLMELVKLRASQINGCAFCIDMDFRDAKKQGESDITKNDDRKLYPSLWAGQSSHGSRS
jgi:AhpD family alkylhydroperoxidase